MEKQKFIIQATNDKIWNLVELLEFLSANQHQSINLTVNPEAISFDEVGLYKILDCFQFQQVTLTTHNPFETHPSYVINHINRNVFIEEDGTVGENCWKWNKKKKFLTIYGRPTAGRIGIASHLFEHHRLDTHLHFSWPADADGVQTFELDKLLGFDIGIIELSGKLIKHMPCCVHDSTGYNKKKYNYHDSLTNLYRDAFVDLVAESHVKGNTFFPTEKTFRPMWCQRPVIIFGSANHLAYLRQMGFRTFGDFWDEDYDGYEGAERFNKILQLVDSLAKKSYDELEQMHWDMKYSLEHNYTVLKNKTYNLNIERIN